MKAAAAVAGGSTLLRAADTQPAVGVPACRNAVVIVTDTLRRDALGCYGGDWIHAPQLDAFARCAVRMDHAYLSSFPTVPCRNDILVGRYSLAYKPWEPMDADAVTLPAILNKAGLQTAMFADTPHPFAPGMLYQRDFAESHLYRGQENDRWGPETLAVKLPCDPSKLRAGKKVVTQYLRNVAGRKSEQDYFVAQTMSGAAEWLTEKRNPDERFFLYVDTFDPHEPWDPPKEYLDIYDPGYKGQDVI
jgi:arylsulfatase A-like enzyme